MTEKINVAIVGYGNIGRAVKYSVDNSPDMNLVGIITRRHSEVKKEISDCRVFSGQEAFNLKNPEIDVAILCGGSKTDLPQQGPIFAKYFNTVDSFDTHSHIPQYFESMNKSARYTGHLSVISAGWDPGTFSVARVNTDSFLPGSKPYAFYGLTEKGGLSMGHSDAIRRVEGVQDARQYTHAKHEGIKRVRDGENPILKEGDRHWRECIVVVKPKRDNPEEKERIKNKIVNDPEYFAKYETTVEFVSQEELNKKYADMPHDGIVLASGTTGIDNKAVIEYRNEWQSNPEATANILVACARAAKRMNIEGKIGAITMLDIPPAYLSPRSREELLKDFM